MRLAVSSDFSFTTLSIHVFSHKCVFSTYSSWNTLFITFALFAVFVKIQSLMERIAQPSFVIFYILAGVNKLWKIYNRCLSSSFATYSFSGRPTFIRFAFSLQFSTSILGFDWSQQLYFFDVNVFSSVWNQEQTTFQHRNESYHFADSTESFEDFRKAVAWYKLLSYSALRTFIKST